ncbi:AhpC/TSA family protein [Candidatus Protochlamydia naegleriophila]|uniref:AhpC/TSA family protein n=2 Tax=Candidatus Protochlamydia naegleriophila TaxID=389348 RepID=A0A0U5J7T0_9BACT|nr:redoxin domain-containing protein [Candidatus Protochlamydia naegleriophila]CUI16137.1 AhpC/TSA family protein [Candidatus Protochlamydia naegleriophila]
MSLVDLSEQFIVKLFFPLYKERFDSSRKLEVDMTALKAGTLAPSFQLLATPDQRLSLSDFKGRPLVLIFYPADWSPVCSDQLSLYNELIHDFKNLNADLVAISVDGVWCHLAFAEERKLHFSLLSDFEPKGETAKAYGVFREADGTTERALFVIDEEGKISWSYVSPIGINPGADGILEALEALQKKSKAS